MVTTENDNLSTKIDPQFFSDNFRTLHGYKIEMDPFWNTPSLPRKVIMNLISLGHFMGIKSRWILFETLPRKIIMNLISFLCLLHSLTLNWISISKTLCSLTHILTWKITPNWANLWTKKGRILIKQKNILHVAR